MLTSTYESRFVYGRESYSVLAINFFFFLHDSFVATCGNRYLHAGLNCASAMPRRGGPPCPRL